MTQGKRRDLPSSRGGFVEYSPIAPGWEYWEQRFNKKFDEKFRKKLCQERHYFLLEKSGYYAGPRMDRKALERELSKAKKNAEFKNPFTQNYLFASISDFRHLNPEATLEEQIDFFISELSADPESFFMCSPKPEVVYTQIFYEKFHNAGFDVKGFSNSTYQKTPGKEFVELPPVIEFINRTVYGVERSTVSDGRKIQRQISSFSKELRRKK